ncbi:hypothetical protein A8C56_17380 [Niabella ginsenosidivorans]|uniref:Uncharacterized protein n=1 Tax=Niabella ginsenosidivorans TaxID=1176587 RepID=A0A1A9I4A2_9BACT|nr:hypothetical protein [Niabella ginsenosidivorans]ANH82507.1 hypothetical protein A8C56_17380 [Niabella ginsenosidivorans]
MNAKKHLRLKTWLEKYPASCVNAHLRQLLSNYIDNRPGDVVQAELVMDVIAVTELLELLEILVLKRHKKRSKPVNIG